MSKAEETLAGDPRATMGAHHRGLGLNDAAVPLLRNLVHERTGIHFEDSRLDMLTDRIAPLVIERGFESFRDGAWELRAVHEPNDDDVVDDGTEIKSRGIEKEVLC